MYTHTPKIITLDMLNSHNIIVYRLYVNKPNTEMEELWVQIIGYPMGEANISLSNFTLLGPTTVIQGCWRRLLFCYLQNHRNKERNENSKDILIFSPQKENVF